MHAGDGPEGGWPFFPTSLPTFGDEDSRLRQVGGSLSGHSLEAIGHEVGQACTHEAASSTSTHQSSVSQSKPHHPTCMSGPPEPSPPCSPPAPSALLLDPYVALLSTALSARHDRPTGLPGGPEDVQCGLQRAGERAHHHQVEVRELAALAGTHSQLAPQGLTDKQREARKGEREGWAINPSVSRPGGRLPPHHGAAASSRLGAEEDCAWYILILGLLSLCLLLCVCCCLTLHCSTPWGVRGASQNTGLSTSTSSEPCSRAATLCVPARHGSRGSRANASSLSARGRAGLRGKRSSAQAWQGV